jgi:hypothetical protein
MEGLRLLSQDAVERRVRVTGHANKILDIVVNVKYIVINNN